jgi:hypothetical protein
VRDSRKQQRAAIETVASRFSATWADGADDADAELVVAGRRVTVDVTTLKRCATPPGAAARPRLRFDKVATRVIDRLQANLTAAVPDGTTVVVTITAPIRLASKTAALLEGKIRTLLATRSTGRDRKDTIHGNRVRIRLVRGESGRAPKLIGFVHHADSDPRLLLNMTREWLGLFGGKAGRRTPSRAGERWLVVISADAISYVDIYRYIYSQLRMTTGFTKILIVFPGRCVDMLAPSPKSLVPA